MVGSRSSLAVFLLLFGALHSCFAQDDPQNRIPRAIDANQRMILSGSAHPRAKPAFDVGRVDGNMKLHGVSLVFKPSPAQQTALEELLREQQDRSSPNYHKWLTPQQYADRFGLSSNDIAKVTSWLRSEGFTVDRVSRSRTQVSFTGTVAQVEAAFRTEMHHYLIDGETHFANATDLAPPEALAGTVRGVRNLHDFRLKSHYTDGSGNHSITPDDFATIYDLKPLYAAGFDGTGQAIAVIGQTEIHQSDLDAFRSAAGLPARTASNFQEVQVPNSGNPDIITANLTDADIGLEWTEAVARNATIVYVFVGNNPTSTAFDALHDAIENNRAPVILITNGDCEANVGKTEVLTIQGWAQQANSQGQTIVAAGGDAGAADCDGKVASATLGLAVDAPASIPEVTGVGGTEFNGDPSSSTTYWNATNTATGGSALSYIPEVVWNDTVANGVLSAGGGGASAIFAKPVWQVATNVPADNMRDVPDVALSASPDHDPYLLCSSKVSPSCVAGFLDGNGNVTIAGGTSVSAPVFAGIVAILNQVTGSRQGNINPTLYSLSVSAPSAFHDIDTGSNTVPCTPGSLDCGSNNTMGFVADVGYDQASGLGSVDANVFVNAWPLDFSITANPNRVAIPTGATGTATITLNPIGSFTSTVSLACTTPSGIALTCAISPTTVTPASPTATLTVFAFGPAASSAKGGPGFEAPAGSSTSLAGSSSAPLYRRQVTRLSLLLFAFAFAFLIAGLSASKRHVSCAFGLLSISTVLILIPACGSHNSGGGSFCTTAPSVPTGLAASSTTPTGTTLNWTAASAGANCSVNSYAVFQNGTSIGTTTTTNMTVTGLSPATTYSFTVAAGDAAGVSAQSSPLSLKTPSPTPAGNYSITIKATSGTAPRYSTTITVAVQ